jgi:hypothetical protein
MTHAVLEQIRSYSLEFLPFNKVLSIDRDRAIATGTGTYLIG